MSNEKRYFAAANGYNGFVSYFDIVFASSDYEKIYVLKGGPGTGKNSFMKAVRRELMSLGCECESIYCSSDPKSLDGIICKNGEKRIAVLDGTSPHERDAVIPGAIDEIINLGQSWDSRFLIGEREKILKLDFEKKKAYKAAYSYLKICGAAKREKETLSPIVRNEKKPKIEIKYKAENKTAIISTRLISSFGKFGKYRFNTFEELSDNVFSLIGDEEYAYELMGEIYEELKEKRFEIIRSPSPFDMNKTEALYLPECKTAYIIGGEGKKIDANRYFIKADKADSERTRVLSELYDSSLKEAERWFNIASDFHFRLEDIYKMCMNFENNDRILKEKLSILRDSLDL